MATVTSARADATRRQRLRSLTPGRIGAWVVMIFFLALSIFPFLWMLRTALSTTRSLASAPGSLLPVDFTWGAFQRVLGLSTQAQAIAEGGSGASVNFWLYLRNSIIYAGSVTIGQVFFCAMAAYAFARLRWPGRNIVFGVFLGALLVPPIFTSLPNFILVKSLGLLNTFPGMILPTFLMTPFAIFFLRQFFLGINREIEESLSRALLRDPDPKLSAATAVELYAVADGRGSPAQRKRIDALLKTLRVRIVAFDEEQVSIARDAYRDFGRGSGHPAILNLGDCFSYALAAQTGEPLLFVGDDFRHTDLEQAAR